jgi:hypothetical protein
MRETHKFSIPHLVGFHNFFFMSTFRRFLHFSSSTQLQTELRKKSAKRRRCFSLFQSTRSYNSENIIILNFFSSPSFTLKEKLCNSHSRGSTQLIHSNHCYIFNSFPPISGLKFFHMLIFLEFILHGQPDMFNEICECFQIAED